MMTSSDYQTLFETCTLATDPNKTFELRAICKIILQNKFVYGEVADLTKIPWWVIACIHFRESDQNFCRHLHNGDPLTSRTTHVPAGRPVGGTPPFTWSQSATDALSQTWRPTEWNMGTAIEYCERYNGLGYQKHGLNSPYVWSNTSAYSSGLFVADGSLDASKKDARPGVCAIIKTLIGWGGAQLDFPTNPAQNLH